MSKLAHLLGVITAVDICNFSLGQFISIYLFDLCVLISAQSRCFIERRLYSGGSTSSNDKMSLAKIAIPLMIMATTMAIGQSRYIKQSICTGSELQSQQTRAQRAMHSAKDKSIWPFSEIQFVTSLDHVVLLVRFALDKYLVTSISLLGWSLLENN